MSSTLARIHRLTPTQFEELVARLLPALGYAEVRRVGGANDRGVDILGHDQHGILTAVQCKRYAPETAVSATAVQHLSAMAVRRHAHHALFVTTGRFTEPARRQAREFDIELIDGPHLAHLVDQYWQATDYLGQVLSPPLPEAVTVTPINPVNPVRPVRHYAPPSPAIKTLPSSTEKSKFGEILSFLWAIFPFYAWIIGLVAIFIWVLLQ